MFLKIKKFWKEYGFEITLVLTIVFMFLIYCFGKQRGTWGRYVISEKEKASPALKKENRDSKGEIECRRVLENLFQKPFKKARPNMLRNPVTSDENSNNNLELDCYNEELKLAVEYNGVQHYTYTPFFHKNKETFQNQKYRDHIKREACKNSGIALIEVPYTVKIENIENFLKKEISKKINR